MMAAFELSVGLWFEVLWLAFLAAPVTWSALWVFVVCAAFCSHHSLEGHTNRAWVFGCSSAIAFVAMLIAGGA